MCTQVGPKNCALDGLHIPMHEGAILRAKKGPAQDMPIHLAVDTLKASQQGAEADMAWMHIGVH